MAATGTKTEPGRGKARVRMVDIAREAGVSPTVVTKVLSGGAGSIRVSPEKAALVREIARRLDYRPNIIARTLVGRPSKIIGVYIDSRATATYFRTLAALERGLTRHGYSTMIAESHDNIGSIVDAYRTFQQYGADAVIFLSHNYGEQAEEVRNQLGALSRTLFIGRPLVEHVAYVDIDWGCGAELAVEHLAARGKRRLGILLSSLNDTLDARYEGFQRAARRLEKQLDCAMFHQLSSVDADGIPEAFERFVQTFRLDGLVMQNDVHATFMMRELKLHGLRVPEDVALVGHDNMEFSAGLCPALTTLDENNETIAAEAVALLLRMLQNEAIPGEAPPTVAPTLIVRETT